MMKDILVTLSIFDRLLSTNSLCSAIASSVIDLAILARDFSSTT
jgi:hypothetical protein